MTDGSTALKEYLVLLDRFGLSESEVIDLHWSGSVPDDASAQRVVAHVVDEDARTPEALFDRLHRTLAASSKGVDTPREYDPDAPGEQLRDVLGPYNTSVELLGPDGERLRFDGPAEPFDVVLTDASGATRSTTFAYPEGPLGTNNLPALLHDVEAELLADTGMTFVSLSERENRWRLLLLSEQRLSALRDTYGEGVEVFDRSLLHDTTLAEFAEPDPQGTDELSAESSAPDWLSGDADTAFEDVGFETAEVEDRDEGETTETKAIDQSGIDDLFDSMEATAGAANGGAGGSDEPAVSDLVAGDADGSDPAAAPETPESAGAVETTEPAGTTETVTADAAASPETTETAESTERQAQGNGEPAVAPSNDPAPAVEPLRVTPSANPDPALSPIDVTPGREPTPAVSRVEESSPAVVPAATEDPADEPAVAPTTGTPTPAVRLTAGAEADRLVDGEPAAAGESPSRAVADDPGSAAPPGPRVRPTDGETRAAVRPVGAATAAESEGSEATEAETDSEDRAGLLSRVTGWLRGLA